MACIAGAALTGHAAPSVSPMDIADRLQIQDLITAVAHGYDALDWDLYGSVWTDDAVMDRGGTSASARTRADIVESARVFRSGLAAQGIQTRHYPSNTMFEPLDANRVRATTAILVAWQHAGEASPQAKHTGLYHDEFVRTAAGWRMASRRLAIDHD